MVEDDADERGEEEQAAAASMPNAETKRETDRRVREFMGFPKANTWPIESVRCARPMSDSESLPEAPMTQVVSAGSKDDMSPAPRCRTSPCCGRLFCRCDRPAEQKLKPRAPGDRLCPDAVAR